jgi:hypothetical protein
MTFGRSKWVKPPKTIPQPIPVSQRRAAVFTRADAAAEPQPKAKSVQHKGYMDAVRSLPCARCGKGPRSEFCHSDEGKGVGIKSDCRAGWPGCHDCHDAVGTRRVYDKETRRALEAEMARKTRAQIILLGLWPANLERWTE